MLVSFSTGHKYLNRHSTLRSFYYSLHVRCLFSWGRALGPFGGLSTGWLNCCLPRMEEKRERAPPFCFFRTKGHGNIPTVTSLTGASNTKEYQKNHDFRPISLSVSEIMLGGVIVRIGSRPGAFKWYQYE